MSENTDEFVLRRMEDAVAVLTLNRPARANAFETEAHALALEKALRECNADTQVRAIVLTGSGTVFCAGGDVDAMLEGRGMFGLDGLAQRDAYRQGIQRIPLAFASLETPVVAAVNGPATGAGCDLAAMCDIRIASETAVFSQAFVRLGLISGDGGAYYLPRVIGHANAMRMALTGEVVDATRALQWGLVSEVVPREILMDAAMRIAAAIAACPPHAVRMTRRLFMGAPARSLVETLELSAALQAICHQSDEHRAALTALADRLARKRFFEPSSPQETKT